MNRPTEDDGFREWLTETFGDRIVREEGVSVTLPPLAENGNSVAFTVNVDSPMLDRDFIRSIDVYAPQNPLPHIGHFEFSPASGRAGVSTRIRLGGDQTVRAVAQKSDGSLLVGGASIVVTEAACLDFLI